MPHSEIQVEVAHTSLIRRSIEVEKTLNGRGDTAHPLLMGEHLGWGHRTTLKELETPSRYPQVFYK